MCGQNIRANQKPLIGQCLKGLVFQHDLVRDLFGQGGNGAKDRLFAVLHLYIQLLPHHTITEPLV